MMKLNDKPPFKIYRMKSGLTVLHSYTPKDKYVKMTLAVLGGARHDPPEKVGISHVVEHTATFGGSARYEQMDINALDAWAASERLILPSPEVGADYTTYRCVADVDNARKALDYLDSTVMHPQLTTCLEAQREIIRAERREGSSLRERDSQRILGRALYRSHPLALVETWPENTTLDITLAADIKGFHRKYYKYPNAILVIKGGLKWEQAKPLIDKVMKHTHGRSKTRPRAQKKVNLGFSPEIKEYHVPVAEAEQTQISYHWLMPLQDIATAEVMRRMLEWVLFAEIREKLQQAYHIDCTVGTHPEVTEFTIELSVAPDQTDTVREVIEKCIANREALEATVPDVICKLLLYTERNEGLVSLSESSVLEEYVMHGKLLSPKAEYEALQAIKEDPSGVLGVIEQWLTAELTHIHMFDS